MLTEIEHPVIGRVTVSKSRRARRIAISVRPPDRVRLSIPYGIPVDEAMKFLESKGEWIIRAKQRVAARTQPDPIIGMPYFTRSHELRLNPTETDRISVRIKDGQIMVTYPIGINYADTRIQAAIKKGIDEAWRIEAREILPSRIAALASQHGFSYRSVAVRNTRSRWGSCSSRDDISLSLRLMKLPEHLVDYIILHELCHTRHKNHGPRFHALLDKVTGGSHPQLRKEMRAYR